MRKAVRTVIVAALFALPFGALAAPAANAACDSVGPVEVCRDGMGDVQVPGVVKICIRFDTKCGS